MSSTNVEKTAPRVAACGRISLKDFRESLGRWVQIVGGYAKRKQPKIGSAAYQDLYDRLLEGCASFRESGLGGAGVDYRKLADMIRPWISLKSMTKADRDILLDLHRQLQAVLTLLDDRRGLLSTPARKVGVVALAAVLSATALTALDSAGRLDPVRERLRDAADRLGSLAPLAARPVPLGIIITVFVAGSIVGLSKAPHT